MTVTAASFRTNYPEFVDTVVFSTAQIDFYIALATKLISADRWKTLFDTGVELFVAHNIALEAHAQKTATAGGIPGMMTGPTSSKSVDKVSVSYDTGAAMMPGAGHWNLTIYGARYIKLMRMFGAGPIQVGMGTQPPYTGAAWPGPLV